jgi:regulator of sirC expression with transglutaminase-like and TPR domain
MASPIAAPAGIEVLDLAKVSAARRELVAMVRGPGTTVDLVRACFLIALDEMEEQAPHDDACLFEIDHLASEVLHVLAGGATLAERLAALHQVLFVEAGFRGNHEDYYDVGNALLPRVLERRRGLPILLSVIYVEVARRVGIQADPVAFPGHFLARCAFDDGFVVVDPFNAGRLLDRAECAELLEEVTDGEQSFDDTLLAPAAEIEVLRRVYLNLRRAHLMAGDIARALRAQDGVVALDPSSIPALHDRARLYARLGAHRLAEMDLVRCLKIGPDSAQLYQTLQEEIDLARRRSRYLA